MASGPLFRSNPKAVPVRVRRNMTNKTVRMSVEARSGSRQQTELGLEEEIHLLRTRLEQAASVEESLTDPKVIEISKRLDLLLNDYMLIRTRL
ncbi:Spo0E like sporulation regulatory protein [compost metagenome]